MKDPVETINKIKIFLTELKDLFALLTPIFGFLIVFIKKLREPALKFIIPILVLIVPVGSIIWGFIYWIAVYLIPDIRKTEVFLFIVLWLTVLTSIYSFVWGVWLYPCLISIQEAVINSLKNNRQSADTKNSNHTQISQNQEGDKS